jgi:GDP-L-fucose synthase
MKEDMLLTGPLEPTNEPYAVAKIAGIELCLAYRRQHGANFIVGIPSNAFGPGDDFSPDNSHVIAALISRMHTAKKDGQPTVSIWGTGSPRRDFIFADDLADACILVMREYDKPEPINLGSGEELSIKELALLVKDAVGFQGQVQSDTSKPDGMPRKLLDASKLLAMGWRPKVSPRSALKATYEWFLQSRAGSPA